MFGHVITVNNNKIKQNNNSYITVNLVVDLSLNLNKTIPRNRRGNFVRRYNGKASIFKFIMIHFPKEFFQCC